MDATQDLPQLPPHLITLLRQVHDNRVTRTRTDSPSRPSTRDRYRFRLHTDAEGGYRTVTALAQQLQNDDLITVTDVRLSGNPGSMFGEFLMATTQRGRDVLDADTVRRIAENPDLCREIERALSDPGCQVHAGRPVRRK